MGHTSWPISTKYYLIKEIAGIKAEIDLLQFLYKMPVVATKFKFYEEKNKKPFLKDE